MAVFVNIRLDAECSSAIASLQKELADKGISRYAEWLGYPPHITLARLETATVEDLANACQQLTRDTSDLLVNLAALGLFGGKRPVVWLSPVPTVGLLSAHQRLCASLAALDIHPNYRPGSWLPHVTLAADLSTADAVAAASALASSFKPIVGRAAAIEIVNFPPANVLWTQTVA